MAILPASGQIAARDLNLTMNQPAAQQVSLGDAMMRSLGAIASGVISLNDFHGKNRATGTITTQTSGSFTVPYGCYSINVTCIGGGGGAGNPSWSGYYGAFYGPGGGGANGITVTNTALAVTPGQIISYTVGAGGSQCTSTVNGGSGSPGIASTFGSVTAPGGAAGYYGGPQPTAQTYGQGGYEVSNSYASNQNGSAGAVTFSY